MDLIEDFSKKMDQNKKNSHNNLAFVSDLAISNPKLHKTEDGEKNNEPDDDFDPYLHRNVEHPTTDAETLLHLLKGSFGTGILAMPNAFYHAGYVLGLIGTVIIGTICTINVHLLVKAEYELCKRAKKGSLTYPATAQAALAGGPQFLRKVAPYAPIVVNTFLLIYQIGACCVYIVFIAENVKSVVDFYGTEIDLKLYMLMLLLPLILLNYVRNLKYLAPLSTGANAVTVVSFGFILYYIIKDVPTFQDREPVAAPRYWPLFLGTVFFALEAIGVIMPLENEMKTPKSFGGPFGVVNKSMILIVTFYSGLGFLGYLTYGSDARGSITLNIGTEEIPAQVIKILYAFAIFISYALQCYVAIDIAWNDYLAKRFEKSNMKNFFEYCTRTVIVVISFLLAIAVPKLELFISLFGAFCLSMLGVAFPALIDTCTHWNKPRNLRFNLTLFRNCFFMVFGLAGLVIGTYTSLSEIVIAFSEAES